LWQLENVRLGQRLHDVTLRIEPGVTAVLGHSGAGKTSLLNLLVGFEKPNAGKLTAEFNRGTHRIALFWVPADGGLWPHLTMLERPSPRHAFGWRTVAAVGRPRAGRQRSGAGDGRAA
jgi:ABC-type multidrug transport system ATPase subunit